MSFSLSITQKSLIACGRHCSICHKFCGTKIELHHIKQRADGGEDSFENCLPLCFDCHADVMQYNPKHPKGKKYTVSELKKHRDNWYIKVEKSSGTIITDPKYIDLDKKTFERLTELLKSDDLMLSIKNNCFVTGSFSDSIMEKVNRFRYECELPEFEFIDADLESLRSELSLFFDDLDENICQSTFGAGPGKQAIPYEWEFNQPERMNKAIDDFNEVSWEITRKYESLIKLGRRKLYAN
jgi:hypothetical protein